VTIYVHDIMVGNADLGAVTGAALDANFGTDYGTDLGSVVGDACASAHGPDGIALSACGYTGGISVVS
jgi:hypothetical protein